MIRTAYGINSITLGSITGTGAGQTIAIIDAYDAPNFVDSTDPNFDTSDLHLFDEQFGIADPPSFLKLNETGGTTLPAASGSTGWSVEESLDVEWAHAIAPQANIILFEANATYDSDLITTAVNTARNWPGVTAVTMSFGRSESSSDTSEETVFTTPSGHAGVTFLASTGDSAAPGEFPGLFAQRRGRGRHDLDHQFQHLRLRQRERLDRRRRRAKRLREPSPATRTASTARVGGRFPTSPSTPIRTRAWRLGTRTTTAVPTPGFRWAGPALRRPVGPAWWPSATKCGLLSGLATMDGPTQTLPLLYAMKAADFHDITTGSNGYPAGVGYDMVTGIGTPVANNWCPLSCPYRRRAT